MKIYLRIVYFTTVIIILYLALTCANLADEARAAGAKTGYIMGRVTLPDEATGVPGCEVTLLEKGDAPGARTTTDASGNFYFTNLAPNDGTWGYRLLVKKGTWGQSVTQLFSVFEDSSTIVAIRIYPYIGSFTLVSDRQTIRADGAARVNLTIALFDVDGKPVPDDVHVRLTQSSFYPNPGTFYAGTMNGAELILPTKGGKVLLQYGGIPGDSLSRSVTLDASGVESSGARSLSLTIDLVNPNVITGTVYDATMRPVPYARVFLSRWNGVGQFVGYNGTEGGNATDGSGICDANGVYRYAVMPAGDYTVTARESTFSNTSRATVVRGTYTLNITLPMGRGSVKGWVKDAGGNPVPGATVSLHRVYDDRLVKMAANATGDGGQFSFEDIWYGNYDLQAVSGDQTVDVPLTLDVPKASVTLTLLHAAPGATATPGPTAQVSAAPTPKPAPQGVTATPKPPTPTPPPVTPSYLLSTYGVAAGVMALLCVAGLAAVLQYRSR